MDKGKKVLLKTFWNSNGYCYVEPKPEAFAIAVEEGYMFEKTHPLSHNETLVALRRVVEQISPEDVANAFLYSLSTRKLEYRSAMGTYWFAKAIPFHEEPEKWRCSCCGWWDGYGDQTNSDSPRLIQQPRHTAENFYNFQRYKFGGRGHAQAQYALFDLQQFVKMPKVTPTDTDRAMLREMLHAIEELEPREKAGAYRQLLVKKKIIPSNQYEISSLIDILGLCGILSTAEHPCPDEDFRGANGIDPPRINDFAYPVNWWKAADGVNAERFRKVFGFDYWEL